MAEQIHVVCEQIMMDDGGYSVRLKVAYPGHRINDAQIEAERLSQEHPEQGMYFVHSVSMAEGVGAR